MPKTDLVNFNAFASNINSQFGEDGIIEEIFSRIYKSRDDGERYCVEFGAWDGKFLSNTYNLIANHNWRAVLIEADKAKYEILCKNIPQSSAIKINEFVTFDGNTTLDEILSRTDIPTKFDLLSIDIDGNDYHILESLKKYRPILICIEFNPTIPNDVDYIQPRDFNIKRGASAKSIVSLASKMGYSVVASTHCNIFLLDRSFTSKVGLNHEPTLESVRSDENSKCYLFSGYDGSLIISRPHKMPWHDLTITDKDLQALPSGLRLFPDDYNIFQRILFHLFRAPREPKEFFKTIRRKLRF